MTAVTDLGFWQHLAELRRCLIKALLAFLLGFILSALMSRDLLGLITARAGDLVFLRPVEALMAQIKVALLNALLVSLPVILWQLGSFLWPALYPREKRTVIIFFPAAFLLFCAGLLFGYFVLVRLGYGFLLSFGSERLQPMISLDKYLSFVLSSSLVCGVVFTLPVVTVILVRLRVLKSAFILRQQKKIVIGLMILIAVLTPTVDAVSMMLVFLPVLLLFELSVFLAWGVEHRRGKH